MKFFLDTEFSERGPEYPIQLISIGIVCENGQEFYRVSQFKSEDCNEWVQANVIPHIGFAVRYPLDFIARAVREFVELNAGTAKPEFWGYSADYDWVVFCQMFGAMIDLPKGWPMYCRDIKQLCDAKGNPKLPEQKNKEHNALHDAQWNMEAYKFLIAQ